MATLDQRGRRGLAGARRGSRWVGRARVAAGSFAADDAGAAWRPTRTRLRPWLVLRSDSVYSAVLTVAITLASAAPIRVPATPKNDAATAEDTAASALAATCTGLSCVRFGASVELSGRTVVSVRGEDMGSGGTRRCTGGRAGSTPIPASPGYGSSEKPAVLDQARHDRDLREGPLV